MEEDSSRDCWAEVGLTIRPPVPETGEGRVKTGLRENEARIKSVLSQGWVRSALSQC